MRLVQLQIFIAVIEHQSFNMAAKHLRLSQSAVSHAITSLESHFETKLIIRRPNRVVLTKIGEKVLKHIQNISKHISSIDQMIETTLTQEIAKELSLETGTIKVGGSQEQLYTLQEEMILNFKKKHPNIKVDVFVGKGNEVEKWVHTSVIDIGLLTLIEEQSSKVKLLRRHYKLDPYPALSIFITHCKDFGLENGLNIYEISC